MSNTNTTHSIKSLNPKTTLFIGFILFLSCISLLFACTNVDSSTRPAVTKVKVRIASNSPMKLKKPCAISTITFDVPNATAANFGIYSKTINAFNPKTPTQVDGYTLPSDANLPTGSTVTYSPTQVVYNITTVAYSSDVPTVGDTISTIIYNNAPSDSDANKGFSYEAACDNN